MEEDPNLKDNKISNEAEGGQTIRSSIRTYEKDASEALKNQNSSLSSIFIAEQKKKETNTPPPKESGPKRWPYVLGGVFLIIVALIAVVFAVLKFFPKNDILQTPVAINKIVVPDKEINIDITDLSSLEIQKELQKVKISSKEKVGDVLVVNLVASTTESIKSADFFAKLSWRIPNKLTRMLEDDYAYGVHSFDGNAPFMVFKVSSYEQAFSGMLDWEKNIVSDLSISFDIPENTPIEVPSESTSTPPTFVIVKDVFVDKVVKNKDTRMVIRNGVPILLYSFSDRKTLIITTNENTFKEIMAHLSADRF